MDYSRKFYSEEMQNSFLDEDWMQHPSIFEFLSEVQKGFETPDPKTAVPMKSFTYLLMDPRITKNLPVRLEAKNESLGVLWADFIDSIFYVGKGTGLRGTSHMREVLKIKDQDIKKLKNRRIREIWSKNLGVILLYAIQDLTSDEAHTYEAAIIDVIGLSNLTNETKGTYYGAAKMFTQNKQKRLGLCLLCKAFDIHNLEEALTWKPENFKVYSSRRDVNL